MGEAMFAMQTTDNYMINTAGSHLQWQFTTCGQCVIAAMEVMMQGTVADMLVQEVMLMGMIGRYPLGAEQAQYQEEGCQKSVMLFDHGVVGGSL